MASSAALKSSKKELRSSIKKLLSTVTDDSVQTQSTAVFHRLINFKPYQRAKRIAVYLAMPTGELQTDAIVRHALESGKQVFVPYLHKSMSLSPDTPRSVMDMVDLRSLADFEALERDSWGIPTIPAETVGERESILETVSSKGGLEMILLPGVAFDIDPKTNFIRRLGHGKGFYDYFLHRYRQQSGSQIPDPANPGTNVLLYGLALQEQFLKPGAEKSVPVGEHDSLLHGLFLGDSEIKDGLVSRE
ncbi:8401546f-16e1-40e6-ae58-3dc42244ec33 [Sclerotinia trifoliorum]|uniref:5-formyltetrahydrofolate cyclo-ligase n=1 Tax=Sclerotinia trifoliorum TaxID=28548 RepID=A0A8H2W3Y9_9HELO|nr:8401546f-16e1-40e6-ae58-3dc42244ec33 [Sclerotinia trifoliorum]